MSIEVINIFTLLLFTLSTIYFLKKNDEFLIIIIFFFFSTGLNRYASVQSGESDWVNVNYAVSIFNFDDSLALEALNLFFLGSFIFILSYMIFNTYLKRPKKTIDDNNQFYSFLLKKKKSIIVLFIFFLLMNSFTRVVLGGSENLAYGNSYAFLFSLAIGGIILLAFLIYRKIDYKKQPVLKITFMGVILFSAFISYNPSLRFQFLSWMIALGMIVFKNMAPGKKLKYYVIGGIGLILFFSLAGVARYHDLGSLALEESYELAVERASSTEDQNMLDGFMMVLQVYPNELDFHYGMEHLEILMRPIPRTWWPEKPVGGYVNKLGLNDGNFQGTIGISQSIYGTFYGEGGTMGIIFFSIFYGFLFVKIFRYASRYNSDMRYLIKGLVFASLIPLLRGGDLPGIIAFIGMSYWPVFIMIYQYNKFLKTKKKFSYRPPSSIKVNNQVLISNHATV